VKPVTETPEIMGIPSRPWDEGWNDHSFFHDLNFRQTSCRACGDRLGTCHGKDRLDTLKQLHRRTCAPPDCGLDVCTDCSRKAKCDVVP
jgi:hypothetical protein